VVEGLDEVGIKKAGDHWKCPWSVVRCWEKSRECLRRHRRE
jgi:hypothetical protein